MCERESGWAGELFHVLFSRKFTGWVKGKVRDQLYLDTNLQSQRCEETEGFVWIAWRSAKEANRFISLSLTTYCRGAHSLNFPYGAQPGLW